MQFQFEFEGWIGDLFKECYLKGEKVPGWNESGKMVNVEEAGAMPGAGGAGAVDLTVVKTLGQNSIGETC